MGGLEYPPAIGSALFLESHHSAVGFMEHLCSSVSQSGSRLLQAYIYIYIGFRSSNKSEAAEFQAARERFNRAAKAKAEAEDAAAKAVLNKRRRR